MRTLTQGSLVVTAYDYDVWQQEKNLLQIYDPNSTNASLSIVGESLATYQLDDNHRCVIDMSDYIRAYGSTANIWVTTQPSEDSPQTVNVGYSVVGLINPDNVLIPISARRSDLGVSIIPPSKIIASAIGAKMEIYPYAGISAEYNGATAAATNPLIGTYSTAGHIRFMLSTSELVAQSDSAYVSVADDGTITAVEQITAAYIGTKDEDEVELDVSADGTISISELFNTERANVYELYIRLETVGDNIWIYFNNADGTFFNNFDLPINIAFDMSVTRGENDKTIVFANVDISVSCGESSTEVVEQDCNQHYVAVRWNSFTGVQRIHTFAVRDISNSVGEKVELKTLDGSYNTIKGRVDSFSLFIDGLTAYDVWYYSDMVTSSKVEISFDGVNWYQVDVTNKSYDVPNNDNSLTDLTIEVNWRKYDAVTM